MKNKITDLNNHLFAQLERLGDEQLTPEQIETEALRAEAIVAVSDQLVKTTALQLQAAKLMFDAGHQIDPKSHLPMLEAKAVEHKLPGSNGKALKQ